MDSGLPNGGLSLFHGPRSTIIYGGEISSSAGGYHNRLVVNIYQGTQVDPDNESTLTGNQNPLAESADSVPVTQPHSSATSEAHTSIEERESPNARYERHLLVQKHGFPLWVPQPHFRLPLSYQRKGVSVGDVGIITRGGYFDFLFNICLPRGHPSNPEFMPINFSPVRLLSTDISEWHQHDSGSCLLTSSTEKLRGLTFKCNGPEGSILVMPNGASHKDLRNLHKFQRTASQNAENWYRFAMGTCGRQIENGELRLITGCDKTNLWGIATYSDFRPGTLTLAANGVHSPGEYTWDYEGHVEAKAGPKLDELLHATGSQEDPRDIWNQCTFLRSFTVTLADDVWKTMVSTLIQDSSDNHILNACEPRSYFTSIVSESFFGFGGRGGTVYARNHNLGSEKSTIHPATIINQMLLSQYPNAKVAISHDNDWCAVIREDETAMPDASELVGRIRETFMSHFDEDGTVYLSQERAPEANPQQQSISRDCLVTIPEYSACARGTLSDATDNTCGEDGKLSARAQGKQPEGPLNTAFSEEGTVSNDEVFARRLTFKEDSPAQQLSSEQKGFIPPTLAAVGPSLSPARRRTQSFPAQGEAVVLLDSLPYDVLLNIIHYLDSHDICTLHLTCKALNAFLLAYPRPVYHKFAIDHLHKSRPLPLEDFQMLSELTTLQLIKVVEKVARPSSSILRKFKVAILSQGEIVDWFLPISSTFCLFSTKSGKVLCWDMTSNACFAEWDPGEKWQVEKIKVVFEQRRVFVVMSRVVDVSELYATKFVLLQLAFPHSPSEESPCDPPVFSSITGFHTTGVPVSTYLLGDRVLVVLLWLGATMLGLYVLPDYNEPSYIFVDMALEPRVSLSWTCILYDGIIVIHHEDSDATHQYFYPFSILLPFARTMATKSENPVIASRVPPSRTLTRKFIFPVRSDAASGAQKPNPDFPGAETTAVPSTTVSTRGTQASSNPNPFPFPKWIPKSTNFIRQWWPCPPNIPRLGSSVTLLSSHWDLESNIIRYVLAQHYFRVPICHEEWNRPKLYGTASDTYGGRRQPFDTSLSAETSKQIAMDDALMEMWYSTPFDIVWSLGDEDNRGARSQPLLAVDFGYTAWIEYIEMDIDRPRPHPRTDPKRLRLATFPAVPNGKGYKDKPTARFGEQRRMQGEETRTLEVPEDLDLGTVQHISIDQSQGTVILSTLNDGTIFTLYYDM